MVFADPPPWWHKFPDIFLPHFFSFAILSYIYETEFSESVPEENTAKYLCVSLCLIQMMGRMASTWGTVSAPGVRRDVYNNFVLFSFTLITWSILINTMILIKFVATWFHIHICRVISNPIQLPSALGRQYAPLVKLHLPSKVFSVRRHVWAGT